MISLSILTCFTLLATNGFKLSSAISVFNMGAILDEQSPIGKEQTAAARVAVRAFNSQSDTLKLNITFKSSSTGLVSSAIAADELVKENKVKIIIGMNEWVDAAAVGEIGSKANIPIVSLSEPDGNSQFNKNLLPFLVSVARSSFEQMNCISGIIRAYSWKRIVVVYEQNLVGAGSGKLDLLAENLKAFNAEIEYSVTIPPLYTLSSPNATIKEALHKVLDIKCRVFVVLQMSFPATALLFKAAKEMGLTEANTVWILANGVANYLDMVNSSVLETMEGVLGVKNYYSVNTANYRDFNNKFREKMFTEYPDSETLAPGIYALRAHDAITTIAEALKKSPRIFNDSNQLLAAISSADGQITSRSGQLSNNELRVVNVVGKSYKELDFCFPENGLTSPVLWPGDFQGTPKGWAVPTIKKKMRIVVPGEIVFDGFVKVIDAENNVFKGFCIDLFTKAVEMLHYNLDVFKLEARTGTYDELVEMVYNKTYDGVVGDVTMLASRLDKVQFTSSYFDSGLSLISVAVSDASAWMFLKPFTGWMWAMTGGVLIYTTFVVWCLERERSPELGDTWREQIGNAVMFTLSSLFFVQRERLHNNLTRAVLIVWLFLVLVLSSSYTASLSAMLTAQKVRPSVTAIDYLVKNNLKVACDRHSFLYKYLQTSHKFKVENIVHIESADDIRKQFESKKVAAAFLETPYKNSFFNHFCGKKIAEKTYNVKFGGLAFAFQKGSPFAEEISKVLLELQVDGEIKKIEDKWFSPSDNCGEEQNFVNKSLEVQSFWALYAISAGTSTVCLLIFLISRIYTQYY